MMKIRREGVKKEIHPKLDDVTVSCACGNIMQVRSTLPDIKATICSACHPFYTGEKRFVDTAGRIEKFEKKYKKKIKKL